HNHVGARIEKKIRSPNSLGKTHSSERVGPPDDNEVRIASRFYCVTNFCQHFFRGNRMFLAHVVVEPLRIKLILEVYSGSSRVLEQPNSALHVCRLAESRTDVHDNGDIHDTCNAPRSLG